MQGITMKTQSERASYPTKFTNSLVNDPLAVSHNVLNRQREYFSQILNVQRASEVRQMEIRTAEAVVPEPSPFGFQTAIEKLKSYKSSGIDQIPAELIQAGGDISHSESQNY
jgi:hypothetical protein